MRQKPSLRNLPAAYDASLLSFQAEVGAPIERCNGFAGRNLTLRLSNVEDSSLPVIE
jgi:hypothetical protein